MTGGEGSGGHNQTPEHAETAERLRRATADEAARSEAARRAASREAAKRAARTARKVQQTKRGKS